MFKQRSTFQSILLGCLLVVLTGFMPTRGAAQSDSLPGVAPEDCVVEPLELEFSRNFGDLNVATPVPTMIAETTGTPASGEVVDAISARVALAIACQNAGDLNRMLANFSQRWIDERFSGYDLVFQQRFFEAAANPTPLAETDRIELVSIEDVVTRTDGMVVAAVVTRQHGQERTSVVLLVETDDGWFIDGGHELVTE
jgi:hypothetical protein